MKRIWNNFRFSRKFSLIKNVTNASFWAFWIFGFFFLVFAGEPGWIYPKVMGVISWLSAFLIALPFIVYQRTSLRTWYEEKFVHTSEALIGIPLSINGLGALFLYEWFWAYDAILHFVASIFGTILIYLVVGVLWRNQTSFDRIVLFFIAIAGGFVAGVGMELFEIGADVLLRTQMWGQSGVDSWIDTSHDFIADGIGVAFAALAIFFWGKQWFIALRRVEPQVRDIRARAVAKVGETREKMQEELVRLRHKTRRVNKQKTP
jgi:hypothetical protein